MKCAATTGKTATRHASPGSSPSFVRTDGDDARPVRSEDTLPVPADGISDLFQTYVQPIYRYCYGRLGRREAAEDATSQTFVNALQSIARRRGDSPWSVALRHRLPRDCG